MEEVTTTSAVATYRYHGLPLTPAVADELITEIFAGRTVKRQEIIGSVVSAHRLRGGAQASATDIRGTIKKIAAELEEEAGFEPICWTLENRGNYGTNRSRACFDSRRSSANQS
jgi:hypothetical protein